MPQFPLCVKFNRKKTTVSATSSNPKIFSLAGLG